MQLGEGEGDTDVSVDHGHNIVCSYKILGSCTFLPSFHLQKVVAGQGGGRGGGGGGMVM